MITYVDTSLLVKLLVEEEGSERAEQVWDVADVVASVELIHVESRAALAAAARRGRLSPAQHRRARVELQGLADQLVIIEVSSELIASAADLAEAESLRGYDAVHLAGAVTVDAAVMATADIELCEAAERRGFHIANPLAS